MYCNRVIYGNKLLLWALYQIFYSKKVSGIYYFISRFIALFIFFDIMLFRLQIGEEVLKDRLSFRIYASTERVMYAYVPVVLVYMFFRNKQLKRKERITLILYHTFSF